jgi:ribonuclease T1
MHSKKAWQKWSLLIGTICLLVSIVGCQAAPSPTGTKVIVTQGQSYSTRDEVAAYINQYHTLPPNYITKGEAQKLGWDSSKGNLWQVSNHKSIGGDRFGNLEGLLPKAAGRQYYECDINYQGGLRGAERIVYSSDGLIFYTADHYQTFRKLY